MPTEWFYRNVQLNPTIQARENVIGFGILLIKGTSVYLSKMIYQYLAKLIGHSKNLTSKLNIEKRMSKL